MKKKSIALLMAVVMLFGVTIGGTLAWLTATTDEVVNTFAPTTVDLILKEHDYDPSTNTLKTGDDNLVTSENGYELVPGKTMPKDPFVKVVGGSEKCWVYVEVTDANNTLDNGKIVNYTVDSTKWTQITGTNVYYYKEPVDVSTKANTETSDPMYVFAGDETFTNGFVTVNSNLTKDKMPTSALAPTITLKAYAVQYFGWEDNAVGAWNATYGV
ncbi:MAG: hypothetical protein IKK99_02465 [Oscillospiraceae bacterium]|nr:hypothetical protein [Oscillospiraceae bacterium]